MAAQPESPDSSEPSQSIEEFYRERRLLLKEAVKRISRNDDGAEDVVQEAFLRLLRRGTTGPVRHLWAYMIKTVRTIIFDRHKRLMRCDNSVPTAQEELTEGSNASRMSGDSEQALRTEFLQVLEELSIDCRTAWILQVEWGYTYDEIAREMVKSRDQVSRLLSRAVAHINAYYAAKSASRSATGDRK